jgi:hypothetical protein
MVRSIHDLNLCEIKRADTLNASDVDSELIGARASLVVGIDATRLAEIVFRSSRMKLIERQVVFTLNKFKISKVGRRGDRTTHSAIGAGAAPVRVEFVGQPNAELDHSTVTGRIVLLPRFAQL